MLPVSVTTELPIAPAEAKDEAADDRGRDKMTGRDVLRELAEQTIGACAGQALGAVGDAAADLLADLYATGLAHDLTPQDWAAVTALPAACWDATVALTRRGQRGNDNPVRTNEHPPVLPRSGFALSRDSDDASAVFPPATQPVRRPVPPTRGLRR